MLEFRVPGSRERAVLFVRGRELLIAALAAEIRWMATAEDAALAIRHVAQEHGDGATRLGRRLSRRVIR